MHDDRLHQLLQDLHREVGSAGTLDEDTRRNLNALADELRALAEKGEGTPEGGLRDRLQEEVQRFEATHPTLAQTLANVIDTLALYGL